MLLRRPWALLAFLIFAGGCAAALVTAEPRDLELGPSITAIAPQAADQITWRIGSSGFDMPSSIGGVLPCRIATIVQGRPLDQVVHWTVHPGGRSALRPHGEIEPPDVRPPTGYPRPPGALDMTTGRMMTEEEAAQGRQARLESLGTDHADALLGQIGTLPEQAASMRANLGRLAGRLKKEQDK